jgi:hypothetical protein
MLESLPMMYPYVMVISINSRQKIHHFMTYYELTFKLQHECPYNNFSKKILQLLSRIGAIGVGMSSKLPTVMFRITKLGGTFVRYSKPLVPKSFDSLWLLQAFK